MGRTYFVKTESNCGYNDHEVVEFSIWRRESKAKTKNTALDLKRTVSECFRDLFEMVPWDESRGMRSPRKIDNIQGSCSSRSKTQLHPSEKEVKKKWQEICVVEQGSSVLLAKFKHTHTQK